MRTFSAMSTPDKMVTLQAYEQLKVLYERLLKSRGHLHSEAKRRHLMNMERLDQLTTQLEEEIASE